MARYSLEPQRFGGVLSLAFFGCFLFATPFGMKRGYAMLARWASPRGWGRMPSLGLKAIVLSSIFDCAKAADEHAVRYAEYSRAF
jgi:hypothetical protein